VAIVIGNRAVRAAQVAYAERLGNDQDKIHAAIEAALLQLVGDATSVDPAGEQLATVRQCRICGCTAQEACTPGCRWSQPQICSTCANRQMLLDEQWLATMRAQQSIAEQQADLLAKASALADEQLEVAKMQREDLAGATWRLAVDCAARDAGSPTETDGAHERITADSEWYAHLLGTPPVVF